MSHRIDLHEFTVAMNNVMRDDRLTNYVATLEGMESARVLTHMEFAIYQIMVLSDRVADLEKRLAALEGDGK